MTINTCILFPRRANWNTHPKLSTAWDASVVGGVTGAEDRSAGSDVPNRSMEWTLTTTAPAASARVNALINAALASGRAAAPLWPLQQSIVGAVTDTATTSSTRSWASGDWAFFSNAIDGRQLDALINCGGPTVGTWVAEKWRVEGDGSETESTEDAIDLTAAQYGKLPYPAQAVYQTARIYSGAVPGTMCYVIPNLQQGIPCRVRLHFCEIGAGFDRTCFVRLQNITVTGSRVQQQLNYEPFAYADYVPNVVQFLDFIDTPDTAGNITITIATARREVVAIALSHVVNPAALTSLDGVTLQAGDIYCLANQNDMVDNGLYIHGSYPSRALWANDINALNGLEFIVRDPAVHGGLWYHCTNSGQAWAIGHDAITIVPSQNTLHDHALISAIQFYQHPWDCVQLTTGTTTGHLTWGGQWLLGIYDDAQVWPVIFGQLKADKIEAHTDYASSVRLTITEPVGTGEQGTPGLCPTEICDGDGWGDIIWVDPPVIESAPPNTIQADTSRYAWSATELSSAQVNFMKRAALYDFERNGGDLNTVIGIMIGDIATTNYYADLGSMWAGNLFTFNWVDDSQFPTYHQISTGKAASVVYLPAT